MLRPNPARELRELARRKKVQDDVLALEWIGPGDKIELRPKRISVAEIELFRNCVDTRCRLVHGIDDNEMCIFSTSPPGSDPDSRNAWLCINHIKSLQRQSRFLHRVVVIMQKAEPDVVGYTCGRITDFDQELLKRKHYDKYIVPLIDQSDFDARLAMLFVSAPITYNSTAEDVEMYVITALEEQIEDEIWQQLRRQWLRTPIVDDDKTSENKSRKYIVLAYPPTKEKYDTIFAQIDNAATSDTCAIDID